MDTAVQAEARPVLCQQPAQCLIIDLARPFSPDNLTLVAECLHNVLPIISVLPGPPRVPLLGIVMANNCNGLSEEMVLGFEKVRGNFTKCFESTQSIHTEFQCSSRMTSQSISSALVKALNLFLSVNKRPGANHELEITIISSLVVYKVRDQIMKAVSMFGTQLLKLVTIFSIVNLEHAVDIDELEVSGDEEPSSCETLINIQHVLLNNVIAEDKLVLRRHFMGWLSDRSRDSHHLQFSLPHPYKEGEMSAMKFDLKEFILPCSALPFHSTTNLELTAAFVKPPHFAAKSEIINYAVPVYQLTVLHQIPYTCALAPFLYGVAMVLEATQCWRMDWDELEMNKCEIGALHAVLHEKKLALVCQLNAQSEEGTTPRPYYCVVPAECCLLVHSLAYNELIVYPNDVMSSSHLPAVHYQHKIDMEMTLAKIDLKERPFDARDLNDAGYIRSISRSILPKRLSSRKRPVTSSASATKRKAKYAPLEGCQPMEVTSRASSCRRLYQRQESTVMASPKKSGCSKMVSLPPLKKPTRPRAVVRSLVRPAITSQIEEPLAVENPSNGSRWISRDNSQPYPTSQSFQLNSVCASLPTSYKQRADTSSCPAPIQLSDDEPDRELSSLSPMQYDGLSQYCPRASPERQPPEELGFTFRDESADGFADFETSHRQQSFFAAQEKFDEDIDGLSDDSICYVERTDGTLSPQ